MAKYTIIANVEFSTDIEADDPDEAMEKFILSLPDGAEFRYDHIQDENGKVVG